MGINDKNFQTLQWLFATCGRDIKTVLELGSQNFYQNYESIRYGVYADKYYKYKGVQSYTCIDTNGENNALVLNLAEQIHDVGKYDLVTDFGTCEHIAPYTIEALYNCWTTKYNAAKTFIISSNPASGHWPKHGYYYFTKEFYTVLAHLTGMKILKLEDQYTMGNYIDGMEVSCTFDVRGSSWITLDEFRLAFVHVKPQ
jgi:hypothetical protein